MKIKLKNGSKIVSNGSKIKLIGQDIIIKHKPMKLTREDFDFYDWEQRTYAPFCDISTLDFTCGALLSDLIDKFKTPPVLYCIAPKDTKEVYSQYFRRTPFTEPKIELSGGPSAAIATLAHEFAHHITCQGKGEKAQHGPKFKKNLEKVYKYLAKKLATIEKVPQ